MSPTIKAGWKKLSGPKAINKLIGMSNNPVNKLINMMVKLYKADSFSSGKSHPKILSVRCLTM